MQLNAEKCHTKDGSMTVDIELALTGVVVGVEVPDATVVVMEPCHLPRL
jgi:RecG-like helicase